MVKHFVTLYSLRSILLIIKFGSIGIKTVGWSRSFEIFAATGPHVNENDKIRKHLKIENLKKKKESSGFWEIWVNEQGKDGRKSSDSSSADKIKQS